MAYEFTEEAQLELADATIWYDRQCVGLGEEFEAKVFRTIEAVERHPEQYGVYEGAVTRRAFRRALVQRFPCVVIVRVDGQLIVIYAVKHTSREPGYWECR
ncbi:MAG: type II toxin-antitoxin system RelE/ParE family toxin [Planctomycetota bacterium]